MGGLAVVVAGLMLAATADARSATKLVVTSGDAVTVSGTHVACKVGLTSGTCSPDTRGTIYGVGIADKYAYLSRYRSSWQTLKLVRQPA